MPKHTIAARIHCEVYPERSKEPSRPTRDFTWPTVFVKLSKKMLHSLFKADSFSQNAVILQNSLEAFNLFGSVDCAVANHILLFLSAVICGVCTRKIHGYYAC